MVLETSRAAFGDNLAVQIIQNIKIIPSDKAEYIPETIHVDIFDSSNFKFDKSVKVGFSTFTPKIKKALYEFFKDNHDVMMDDFLSIVHPSTVIASSAIVSNGFYIEPNSTISPFAKIGFGVSINRNTSIGHHTTIHDFATIGPGVNIGGNSIIEKGVQIGIGATVFNEVVIGENSVIGAGSLVTKDIPANCIAYGNPCKIVKYI